MVYLSEFHFPSRETEYDFMFGIKRTCYDTAYPFGILTKHGLGRLDFEPVTILYGGNGSGKTTALNVMAETLGLPRDSRYNRSNFFEAYTRNCSFEWGEQPQDSRVITSDDVFDFMLNLRAINEGVDRRREELFEEYLEAKHAKFQMRSLEDYERLKQVTQARRRTQSKYVRENLAGNVREHSNGESALLYFQEKMQDGGLYLLDEPENSLSPEKQLELCQFLEESARFFRCQLIIATHSPFLLAMRGAKIYDFDQDPVDVKPWTELANVRMYFDFFQKHAGEFD